MMKISYNQCKWLNLMGFALLYNTIYIGRFNLDNALPALSAELSLLPYQQTLLSSSVFFTYAIGSFINGRIADRYNPRVLVAVGVVASMLCNLLVIFLEHWQGILVVWLANGYFQSMVWISGMCLIARWWSSKDRGLACGIANFFSGLSHVAAYVIPMAITLIFPYISWRKAFVIPVGIMAIFLILFWLLSAESPQSIGEAAYIETNSLVAGREEYLKREVHETHGNSWKYFFTRPKFIWWCVIALLSSLCRYGLLKWIPIYYKLSGQAEYILNPMFSNLILPIGMAFGTLIITWIAGTKFILNKGLMIICSAALCGSLMLTFPIMDSTIGILIGIFCTGFFLYGINGVLWLYALDRGGRVYGGTTVGVLNCCAYLGAAMEAFVFPFVLNLAGEMISIFIVMEIICIGMVVCGMVVSEKDTSFEVDNM
ncbi:MAG: MFS transporter [Anaerovorax sp.]